MTPGSGPALQLPLAQLRLRPRGKRHRRTRQRGLRARAARRAVLAVGRVRRVGRLGLGCGGPAPRVRCLGAYRMEDMLLIEKLTWEVPVNWKVVVDGFNENYHVRAALGRAAGRQGRRGEHLRGVRSARHDGCAVQGRAAGAPADRRPPGPGHRPLHGLPDGGVKQQPDAHPAVPARAAGGRPDPLRVLGAAIPAQGRPRVLGRRHQALGATEGGRRRGRGDLRRGRCDPGLLGQRPQTAERPRVQDHHFHEFVQEMLDA